VRHSLLAAVITYIAAIKKRLKLLNDPPNGPAT